MSWAGENILLDDLPFKDRASSIEEFAKGKFCHISFGVWVAPTWYALWETSYHYFPKYICLNLSSSYVIFDYVGGLSSTP